MCYINSILQCLFSSQQLVEYFKSKNKNESMNELANEFSELVKAVWVNGTKAISAKDLKNIIGRKEERFSRDDQQDSHEFLVALLNGLHDDLIKTRDQVLYFILDYNN